MYPLIHISPNTQKIPKIPLKNHNLKIHLLFQVSQKGNKTSGCESWVDTKVKKSPKLP